MARTSSPAPTRGRLTSLTARLLTAGLGLAAVAAPLAAAAPADAVVHPYASCADVAAANPGAPDGTYGITVFGKSLDVWCADLATAPVEYLSLSGTNLSVDNIVAGITRSSAYDRVRLQLPTSAGAPFTVRTTDARFAAVTGGAVVPFATAGSCGWRRGTMAVDLSGTPFAVDPAELAYYGWAAAGDIIPSGPQQVVGWVEGECGGVGPRDQTPVPNSWENVNADVLPLVWTAGVAPVVTGPADVTVASGGDATFTTSATGDPTLSVRWQTSTDGTTWSDLPGATTASLTLGDLRYSENGTRVRAVWTNAEGSATSAAATLTVLPLAPTFTTSPQPVTVVAGGDATFTAAATGDPAPTLQWQASDDGTTWTDLPGETGVTLVAEDVPGESDGVLVRVVATNAGGSLASTAARLTVTPVAPTVVPAPSSAPTAAVGGTATLAVDVTGSPAPTVQWQVRGPGGTWTDVAGATGTTLTLSGLTSAQDGAVYRALVTNAGGTVASQEFTVRVAAAPAPVAAPVAAPAPAGAPSAAAPSAALATTGTEPAPLLAVALAFLATGAAALTVSRRTRPAR